ncbi:MAG TPA: FAD-binding oxidoreductase [Polyangia bacterium]|nr:FAD-binding oxidoreductase [Polyangia bacterium]
MHAEPILSGWGHAPVVPASEVRSEDLTAATRGMPLSRGLGRSYGDSSLPAARDHRVASTVLADRILAFDAQTGLMRAEAGLSLSDIYRLFLARGWFVPVTPGTQFVTVGGMVAADVHGGNHHRDGCFGGHVTRLLMQLADGRVLECSRDVEPDLFRATVGGMGLTGHILEVEFRMAKISSPWLWGDRQRVNGVGQFFDSLGRSASDWPFTKGWIDCISGGKSLGRGVMYRARWATPDEAPPRPPRHKKGFAIPFFLPSWVLNRASARLYNEFRFRTQRTKAAGIVHPDEFFYPLDGIRHWNRLFGRPGFTQYQCVVPHATGLQTITRAIQLVNKRGFASPVCVIKDCGPEGEGLLSFPKLGISIAIDVPVRSWTQPLIDELNELVLGEGGRIYLAKDAFTRREHFQKMEPRLAEWQAIRRRWDPDGRFRSAQSVRLLGDAP